MGVIDHKGLESYLAPTPLVEDLFESCWTPTPTLQLLVFFKKIQNKTIVGVSVSVLRPVFVSVLHSWNQCL